jgi:flagellar biosynthesis/type III secretory pathway chaperone
VEELNLASTTSSALSHLLSQEFSALASKDFEKVEQIQEEKLSLMQELQSVWDVLKQSETTDTQLLDELTQKLEICKEQHMRNSLLLNKQMEITRNLLGAITQKNNANAAVYDKLGKMT